MRSDEPQAAEFRCDHAYASIHQPDLPVFWIRQCSACQRFDADDMRRELVDAGWILRDGGDGS